MLFRVYYYINERIARYEHQRTILEIFLIVIILFMELSSSGKYSFLGGLLGALTMYILVRTHMNYLTEKAENETQHQCITDYGRNHYGVSCSAGITIWLVVNKLQDINLAPQTFIEPIQQVAEFIKEKDRL